MTADLGASVNNFSFMLPQEKRKKQFYDLLTPIIAKIQIALVRDIFLSFWMRTITAIIWGGKNTVFFCKISDRKRVIRSGLQKQRIGLTELL